MHLTFEDLTRYYDELANEHKKLQVRHKKLLEALRKINPDDTYENYNEQIALEAIEADRKEE